MYSTLCNDGTFHNSTWWQVSNTLGLLYDFPAKALDRGRLLPSIGSRSRSTNYWIHWFIVSPHRFLSRLDFNLDPDHGLILTNYFKWLFHHVGKIPQQHTLPSKLFTMRLWIQEKHMYMIIWCNISEKEDLTSFI